MMCRRTPYRMSRPAKATEEQARALLALAYGDSRIAKWIEEAPAILRAWVAENEKPAKKAMGAAA